MAHEDYMQSGDTSLADKNFALLMNNTMLPFIDPVSQLVNWTNHVVKSQYNSVCHNSSSYFPPNVSDGGSSCDITDWQPSYREGFVFTNINTIINAFAVESMTLLAELALVTGREHEASLLNQQANATRTAMLATMYSSQHLWCDGICAQTPNASTSYHTQHFLLWLGLTPSSEVPFALTYLQEKGMLGSVYSAYSLLTGLYTRAADLDQGQLALTLLTQCSNYSWCAVIFYC